MNENKLNNDIKENEESIEGVSNDNVKSDINTESDGVFNCENSNMKKGKSVVATMVILGLGLCLGSSLIVLKKHMNESTIAKDIISISSLKDLNGGIVDITKYATDNYPKRYDLIAEYGSGELELNDGKTLMYSYSFNGKGIDVKILDKEDSVIFKTKINKNDYVIDIKGCEVLKDEVLLNVWYGDGENHIDSYILKFDLKGNLLSEFSLGRYVSLAKVDDLGNLLTYVTNWYDTAIDAKVIKFNENGEKIFEYTLSDNQKIVNFRELFVTDENKVIVFTSTFKGKAYSSEGTLNYIVLDENGKEVYKKDLGYKSYEIGDIVQTSDGGFVVSKLELLKSNSYNCKLKSISKVDEQFNEVWTKEINKVVEYSKIEKFNDEYVISIREYYGIEGSAKKQNKIYSLTKINSFGELAWCKYFVKGSNISESTYIDLDKGLYIDNENLMMQATIYENGASQSYLNITIDTNGNINKI